jgi:O-antigen ligase
MNINLYKDYIFKYGSYILMTFLPVVFWGSLYYPYISTKTLFFYTFVEIIFCYWIYIIVLDKSFRIPKKSLLYFIPMACFITWMTISGIYGVNPHLSFWSSIGRGTGLLTLYHCLAFAFILRSLIYKYGLSYIYKLFEYVVLGGFLLISTVLLGQVGLNLQYKFFLLAGQGGSLGNSSIAAVYLTFVVGIALLLIFSKGYISKKKKWMMGGVITLIILSPLFIQIKNIFNNGMVVGFARGSAFSVLVGFFAFLVFYLMLSKKKLFKIIGLILVFFGVVSSIVFVHALVTPGTFFNKKFIETTSESRLIFWHSASSAVREHPLLGYGPENFRVVFQDNFNSDILIKSNTTEGWSDKPHNVFYEVGVSGGYPALVLYTVFLCSLFYFLYRLNRNKNINRLQISVLGSLLVAYIFQNLFIFDTLPTLALLFIIASFIYTIQDNVPINEEIVKSESKESYFLLIPLCVLCITLLTFFVIKPLFKINLYSKVFASNVGLRPNMYKDLLHGSSVGRDWDVSGLAYEQFVLYAQSLGQIKNNKQLIPYFKKDLESLLVYLAEVSKDNKNDYRLYLTRVYLQNFMFDMEEKSMDKDTENKLLDILNYADSLSPNSPITKWATAQVQTTAGDLKEAEASFKEAIALNPKIETSHILLIMFAKLHNNKILYNQALKQASIDIPGFVFNN